MANVGNKLLYLRKEKNIERSTAAEYFGISEEELQEIELYNGDYDAALLIRSCKLYDTSIFFLLADNETVTVFKTPPEDYIKYDDTIKCFDKLVNTQRKDLNFIRKPDCCKGPASDYFAWRVLSSEYCLKGYVTMLDINKIDYLRDGDIVVAVALKKPVYGFFRVTDEGVYISPVNNPQQRINPKAKGVRMFGLVKHLDITVN